MNSEYHQALKRPTTSKGRGWSYADNESMLAALCQAIGANLCLQPEAIWEWCKLNGCNYDQLRHYSIKDLEDCLLLAIFNDCTIEKIKSEIDHQLEGTNP